MCKSIIYSVMVSYVKHVSLYYTWCRRKSVACIMEQCVTFIYKAINVTSK